MWRVSCRWALLLCGSKIATSLGSMAPGLRNSPPHGSDGRHFLCPIVCAIAQVLHPLLLSLPQALDARTPASSLAQPGGLGRVASALATTVQRPGGSRAPRFSFASGGDQGLLDLEGWVLCC